jgi:glycogen operon protein
MTDPDWQFPEGHFLSYVLAPIAEGGEPLFIVFNAAGEDIEFKLPEWPNVARWTAVLDTASYPKPPDSAEQASGTALSIAASSVLAFSGRP